MRKSILGILGLAVVVWAATAGELDATFGTDGVVVDPATNGGYLIGMAVQSDDKIVAVGLDGGLSTGAGEPYWRISRFKADGDLDTTFGAGGDVVLFDDPSILAYQAANDVAIDSSGRVLVCGVGYETILAGNGRKKREQTVGGGYVVRLDGDGSLDTGFGDGGKVLTPLDRATALVIQPNDKIVVGGYATAASGGGGRGKKGGGSNSSDAFALVRLDSDGTLDTAFGDDGFVVDDISTNDEEVHSLALQSDGSIVVTGGRSGSAAAWYLVRYHGNGDLDTSFGTDGRVDLDDRSYVAVDSSGRLLVAGAGIARYTSSGSLDTSFGTNGVTSLPGPSWTAPVVQSDGKMVVGYEFLASTGNHDVAVTRLLSDGTEDTSFGTGGDGEAVDVGNAERMYALALDSQGRICCGGLTNAAGFGGTWEPDWLLARYCD